MPLIVKIGDVANLNEEIKADVCVFEKTKSRNITETWVSKQGDEYLLYEFPSDSSNLDLAEEFYRKAVRLTIKTGFQSLILPLILLDDEKLVPELYRRAKTAIREELQETNLTVYLVLDELDCIDIRLQLPRALQNLLIENKPQAPNYVSDFSDFKYACEIVAFKTVEESKVTDILRKIQNQNYGVESERARKWYEEHADKYELPCFEEIRDKMQAIDKRTLAYNVLRGNHKGNVRKQTLVLLALAMGLTWEQAKDFFSESGHVLDPQNLDDRIYIHYLQNSNLCYDFIETIESMDRVLIAGKIEPLCNCL